MLRYLLLMLLVAGSTACGPPASSTAASGDTPELTDEVIHERINDARVYDIPHESGASPNSNTPPITWGFDFDEPKEITVVSRDVRGKRATVILDIKTRTNPQRRGPVRQVFGQIKTEWELATGWVLRRWEIDHVENISMKYRDDPPPAVPPSPGR